MSSDRVRSVFVCNGASPPNDVDESKCTILDYRSSDGSKPNVRLGLPDFVRSVFYLSPRCLDLLEIAAYVFAGDRLTPRGSRKAVEYQSWSRSLSFIVKVRDYEFWHQSSVGEALKAALRFATGDHDYEFTFQPDHATPPTSLFDEEVFSIETCMMEISPSCYFLVVLIPLQVSCNDWSKPVNMFA